MLYEGRQITSNADRLNKVSLDYVYHLIKSPNNDIEAKIRQLRIIRDVDKKKYTLLKKELPYLVCGAFNPPFRRTENFAYIEYFVVDIDHISQKGLSIADTRKIIENDTRTVMSFISPGEDGLKVLFRLNQKCYDHGIYSLFYKLFVRQFSEQYNLEQVVDSRTSDVCRACFISSDPDIFFRPEAVPIDINEYLELDNPQSLFEAKRREEEQLQQKMLQTQAEEAVKEKDPDNDSLQKIKEILKLKSRPAEKPPIEVPEPLNMIMDALRSYIEDTGIVVTEVINISYGKKIRMKLEMKQAEINLFYGKRGYSVVISPRCGTNEEFNGIAAELIQSFLNQQGL